MGRPKGSTDRKPRECKYSRVCIMCGLVFNTARPESRTCINLCRSMLRRWRKLYKCDPTKPPGGILLPTLFQDRTQWYRDHLPKGHPLNVKPTTKKQR